jgi:hypothetical protein
MTDYNRENFTSLMIKKELKYELEQIATMQTKKMTYPQILKMLINYYYEGEDKIKNELFNENN